MNVPVPATGKYRENTAGALKILFAASEVYPLVKTGGLADVAGSLPLALAQMDVDVRIVMPAYQCVCEKTSGFRAGKHFELPGTGTTARLLKGYLKGSHIQIYLVDAAEYFMRPGGPYHDESGHDWPDNAMRFAVFSRAIQAIATGSANLRWQPDIVHCNDWHTGLVPALLSLQDNRPATVFSIHNLAYQGDFPYDTFRTLGLPAQFWSPDALEFHGRLSFIKGGLVYADRLVAVSPTYAREITTPEYGYGLEGLLSHRSAALSGILNGVDYHFWDPGQDSVIHSSYTADNPAGKSANKSWLQEKLQLTPDPEAVMLTHISRLTWQKGVDLIIERLDDIMRDEAVQLVILGTGERKYENNLLDAAYRYPGRMALLFKYDEALAHQIQAGADILLMPSRFEPCGLSQMYALRYGTIPVVRRTGGLADTVVDTSDVTLNQGTANGFVFDNASPDDLLAAIHRAVTCKRDVKTWIKIMSTAMHIDHDWKKSAADYLGIYRELAGPHSGDG